MNDRGEGVWRARRAVRWRALAVVGWLLAAAAQATGPDPLPWQGPVRFPSAHPFQSIFLEAPLLDAELPPRAQFDIRISHFSTMTVSPNLFTTAAGAQLRANTAAGRPQQPLDDGLLTAESAARPGETFLFADTETTRLDLTWLQPFGSRWAVEVEVPWYGHHGGFFDPVIKGFHAAFNFPDLHRSDAPENHTQLVVAKDGRSRVYRGPFEPGLGDIIVRGLHAPLRDGADHPAVMLMAGVKAPTGPVSRFMGSGRWEYQIGLYTAKQLGQFRLNGGLGYTWHPGWGALPDLPVQDTFDLQVGVEYRVSRKWSCQATLWRQEHALGPAAPDTFGHASWLLGTGFRMRLERNLAMEGGFYENLSERNNAYDAGIQYRIRWAPDW